MNRTERIEIAENALAEFVAKYPGNGQMGAQIRSRKMYETTTTLYREEFATRREYLEIYRDFCKHYGFKVRIEGGWAFFTFADDYRTWHNQR